MQSTPQTANVNCLSGLPFFPSINKCLSFAVFSLVFAFYTFYKELSTISPPRSFWSLILCFNLLLSIFITIFHDLVCYSLILEYTSYPAISLFLLFTAWTFCIKYNSKHVPYHLFSYCTCRLSSFLSPKGCFRIVFSATESLLFSSNIQRKLQSQPLLPRLIPFFWRGQWWLQAFLNHLNNNML